MKFITIYHGTGIDDTLPQAERQKRLLATLKTTLDMKKKLGDKFRFFGVPGQSPAMIFTIVDVADPEELRTLLQPVPALHDGTYEYESYAVAESTVKSLEAAIAALRPAK